MPYVVVVQMHDTFQQLFKDDEENIEQPDSWEIRRIEQYLKKKRQEQHN